jgi:small subunit ribosomal protein S20
MANIKSARKRARQAIERRDHNMSLRTAVRTAIKNAKKAIAGGDKATVTRAAWRSPSRLSSNS